MGSDPPPRYIAIRPFDDVAPAPAAGLAAGSAIDAIRRDLVNDAAPLKRDGYTFARQLRDIPRDPDRGGFITVPQFNALVIEPPVGTPVEKLREALDERYALMPNVELTTPALAEGADVDPADVRPILETLPEDTGVHEARDGGEEGAGAVVAILDSGCDTLHREFAGRNVDSAAVPEDDSPIALGPAADATTHGTHVSGIVAGAVVGIAPQAEVISVQVMESMTLTSTMVRVMRALYWLAERLSAEPYRDKPAILNMSLGFDPKDPAVQAEGGVEEKLRGIRLLMQQVAVARRILPVVAIGNSGPDTACAPGFFPESLAVGALDYTGGSWEYSSGGRGAPGFEDECNPDIAGYGVDVVSATHRDDADGSRYGMKSGTSMAAPYVTGIAALVAAKTQLHGLELREHLMRNALDVGLTPERAGRGLARYAI